MFVSIYDTIAMGVRSMHAVLEAEGCPSSILLFRDRIGNYGFRYNEPQPDNWPTKREYGLFRKLMEQEKPDILAISFRSFALDIVKELTAIAREAAGPLIVWGGTHPTLFPEECMDTADVVCVGEGEGAMLELVRAAGSGSDITAIANLWTRDGGEVIKNPPRPLIQDLDALPFPVFGNDGKFTIDNDSLLDRDVYLGSCSAVMYFVMGSRGCPFTCDFCTNSAFREMYSGLGKFVRKRSPANIVAEIEAASSELRVEMVAFMDEIFTLNRQWTSEICGIYRDRIDAPFLIDLHPANVDDVLVKTLSEAGAKWANLGVQSGAESSRRENYHRNTPDQEILRAAKSLDRYGIITYYDFIFDNPYETGEDLRETLNLILSLPRPHNLKILSLCYMPRTTLTERALADGTITEADLDQFSKKTFLDHWCNFHNSIDDMNRFYAGMAWLDLLKFNYEEMALTFFSNNYGDSFHVVPRPAIRALSRSSLLRKRPRLVFGALSFLMRNVNRALVPVRKARTFLRLLVRGRWKDLLRKAGRSRSADVNRT